MKVWLFTLYFVYILVIPAQLLHCFLNNFLAIVHNLYMAQIYVFTIFLHLWQ